MLISRFIRLVRSNWTARLAAAVALCLLPIAGLPVQSPRGAAPISEGEAAVQILRLLNAWRIDEGLWPLKLNATLNAMAAAQARYIATKLNSIQDETDYHIDAQGRNPRERAVQNPYNWPSFGAANRVMIGENAGLGSPTFALNFWKGSDPHRKAALNGAYREVGVAAVAVKGGGFLFYTDFGARPGILTTLVSPDHSTLYFTNESARYTTWNPAITQLRLIDAVGHTIADTFPFEKTYTLPSGVSGIIKVTYFNADTQVADTVDLAQDVAVLPGGSPVAQAPTQPFPTVPPTKVLPTLPPTNTPRGSVNATATTIPVQPTQTLATANPTPTSTLASDATPSLTLIYNAKSLTLLNSGTRALNLVGLSVGTDTYRVTIDRWLTVAVFPASAFPVGSCLQLRLNGSNAPSAPDCKYVRSVIELGSSRLFWLSGTFTVTQGGNPLALCDAVAKRCEVNVP